MVGCVSSEGVFVEDTARIVRERGSRVNRTVSVLSQNPHKAQG
jgi:hypothetical protein